RAERVVRPAGDACPARIGRSRRSPASAPSCLTLRRMSATTLTGLLLIAMPLAFNASFALLGMRFDYPDILRRPTDEVLARFREGGSSLVLLWWAFALTAVLFAPVVVLLSQAIADA